MAANIIPKDVAHMVAAHAEGDYVLAKELHYRMFSLVEALFLETNPIPVKAALALMGRCSDELRLPLSSMTLQNLERLKQALKEYGLI